MPRKVYLDRLDLTDFRNYGALNLTLDSRHVVLTGENGAGKTNLLEAVSLLSPGRGMRRAAYGDIARSGAGAGFVVFAALQGLAGPVEIGTTAGAPGETSARRVRVNGAPASASDELLDHVRLAWLVPSMDGLFTASAGERRRFLDRLVLAIDPLHGKRSLDYEKAMRSRNRLLGEDRLDPVWLDGLEMQMAELGVAMAQARRDYVDLLRRVVSDMRGEGTAFPSAVMELAGFLDEMRDDAAVDTENAFQKSLAAGRRRDQAAGRTLEGPHRADLVIRHAEKNMPAALCSTGEQKALLVGIVLAHARLTAKMTGAAPVLLLDEVAAHLDAARRAALFDLVDALGSQAFMTGTDREMFSSLGDRARFFTVAEGSVVATN